MSEITFKLAYPAQAARPDLSSIELPVPIDFDRSRPPAERDEFDASLNADGMAFEIAQWAVSSGLAVSIIKAVKDVLVKHLETRRAVVEVSIGKRKITLQGPMKADLIEKAIDRIALDDAE